MRIIALDTETTGLRHSEGHRIIEIGAIDISNHSVQTNKFHQYINPKREVDERATEIHGFTYESLKSYPIFKEIAQNFLTYLINANQILIHNADFDMGFLSYEYRLIGIDFEEFLRKHSIEVIDTLKIAREMYPGKKNSLDALCKRFDVDNKDRQLHGALLDSKLLAQVYLSILNLDAQNVLFKGESNSSQLSEDSFFGAVQRDLSHISPPVIMATDEEVELHHRYIDRIKS